MGSEPETPDEGTGIDYGGETARLVESMTGGASASPAAETERVVGQVLDDGLAATGIDPSPPAVPPGSADAADRALFVLGTLDDVAAPLPAPGPGVVPSEEPPTPADGATSEDGLLHVEGVDLGGPAAEMERPARGSTYAVRHRYTNVLAGLAIVGLAAFLGALLFMAGSGGSGGSPSASPAASGAAIVAGPSGEAPSAEATTPTLEPSPTETGPASGPPSTAPTAVPQSVTLRGPIDVRAMTKTGLTIGQHDLELVVFNDTGQVTGSFVIAIEEFPIGALLTRTFSGDDDPGFAAFKKCTVRMVLEGGATGSYNAKTGKLSGKATFKPVSEDVHDCLKTRPSNLAIDPNDAVKPTTVTWSATFDGKRAKGTLVLDPALTFSATPED